MEITEVRVKLVEGKQDKLKAFCSITIDDAFVIRDLKIIEGAKGLFVAMPSRKITVRCDACGAKNQIGARFCGQCGSSLPQEKGSRGRDGRLKLHADIAHPINSRCRESIQSRVLESFEDEIEAASQPGYEPASFDDFDAEPESSFDLEIEEEARPPRRDFVVPPPRERSHAERGNGGRDRGQDRSHSDRGNGQDRGSADRGNGQDRGASERRNPAARRQREKPRRNLGFEEENRFRREKTVETNNPPPDDNFGAGLF